MKEKEDAVASTFTASADKGGMSYEPNIVQPPSSSSKTTAEVVAMREREDSPPVSTFAASANDGGMSYEPNIDRKSAASLPPKQPQRVVKMQEKEAPEASTFAASTNDGGMSYEPNIVRQQQDTQRIVRMQ